MNTATTVKKRAYHHGDLRHALIEATRALVEEKGPDHFSVAEAARKAGVSKAAPYKHFTDRDDMLMAVVMDAMDRKAKRMQEALAPFEVTDPDRLTAIGKDYIRFAQAEPNLFRLVFGLAERHEDVEAAVDKGSKVFGLVVQTVADILGVSHADPVAHERAFMAWSFVHGLSFLLIDGKVSSMGLDVDIEAMVDNVTHRVLAPTPTL